MKENISNRLKQIMSQRNLKQVDILNMSAPLQKKYNIRLAKNDLSQYVNGKVEPNQERIFLLSKTLGISEAWLLGYNVPQQPIDKEDNTSDLIDVYTKLQERRKNKVYNYATHQLEQQNKVQIYGQVAASPQALDYIEDGFNDYITENVPNNADGALVINGDSMEPDYPNGSIVFYKKQENVENGEVAIVDIDGDGATCKKIIYDYDNQKVILRSLNEDYPDRVLKDEEYRIIGKVVK